jgi:hypothetical protein
MRFWIAGPRLFRGMIRLGLSFGPEDFRRRPSPRRRQSRQLSGSFIYVIQADNGMLKIGISSNPSARLAQLRTASPSALSFAYIAALRSDGRAVEAEAHRTLAGYRQNGEWFNCPAEMAVAAIGAAAYRLREPLASGDPKLADEVVRMTAADGRGRHSEDSVRRYPAADRGIAATT